MSLFRLGTLQRRVNLAMSAVVLCTVSTLGVAATAGADPASPALDLSSTPSSVTFGQSITLVATLDSPAPGSVDFKVNGTDVSACLAQPVDTSAAPYTATCSYTPSSSATFSVDATFNPTDPTSYNAASAGQITVIVHASSQAALSVNPAQGVYGTVVTLSAEGGSGTGAVSFAAVDGTATGCAVNADALSASSAGSCLVSATRAGDTNYGPITSPQINVVFARADQSPLSLASSSSVFGVPLSLSVTGGSGSGALSFGVSNGTASGCRVTGTSLSATSAGTCLVQATKALDADYLAISSSTVSFTFARAAQLALSVTSLSGTFGSPLPLSASGGSGTGTLGFSVVNGSAGGCAISVGGLTAESAGTCLVRATRTGDANYLPASSSLTTVTFAKAVQSALHLSSLRGTYGARIVLSARGGSGTGVVSFQARDGSARGCRVISSTGHAALISTSAGTCQVQVLKSADHNYLAAAGSFTTVSIARAQQRALTLKSQTGLVGAKLALQWRGGSGGGGVTVNVVNGTATGCAAGAGVVTASTAGTCEVTLTKGASADYRAITATTVTFTFLRLAQAPLTLFGARGTVGTALVVSVGGGSGTGAVRVTLVGGTSTSCSVNGFTLSASSAGTCVVTATKKGDGRYRAVNSAPATFTFSRKRPALSIVVAPASGLRAGSRVSVSGRGFTAHEHVVILECESGATSIAMCDRANEQSRVVDKNGVLAPVSFVVETGQIGQRICGMATSNLTSCELRVSKANFTQAKAVALGFVAPPSGRFFTVTPSTGLKKGEAITLSGSGFIPGDRVFYAECLAGSLNEARCDLATFKSVKITPEGKFPPTKLIVYAGQVGPGSCGTDSGDLSACDVSVANSSLGDAAVANITFKAP